MTMYDDSRVVTLLREIDPPLGPPDRLQEVRRRAHRQESRRTTALAGVLAVVLGAGVLSAFHFGDRGGTQILTVAGAADATAAARTARVTMRLTFAGADAAALGTGSYTLSGPVDFEHQRFSLKGTLAGQGFELRGIGKDQWTTQLGITGKKWTHSTDDDRGRGFEQIDPARLLDLLTSKGEQVSRKVVGDRTVFVLRVPSDVLTPGAPTEGGPMEVTVAVDENGLVRTLETTSESGTSVEVKIFMSYDDFGIAVDVQPPPPGEVADIADLTEQFRSSTQQFSGAPSAEQQKQACDMFKRVRQQQPAPQTAQEKAQRRQLDETMAQICGKS
jgi:hypothetical protein